MPVWILGANRWTIVDSDELMVLRSILYTYYYSMALVLSTRDWYLCGTISDHIFRLLLLTWFMQADITQFNDHPIVRRIDLSNISSISWSKEFVAIFILFLEMLIYLLSRTQSLQAWLALTLLFTTVVTIKHAYLNLKAVIVNIICFDLYKSRLFYLTQMSYF